jgi:hypothetical protein
MTQKLVLDDEWSIMFIHAGWRMLHYCAEAVYSWDKPKQEKAWALVGRPEFGMDPVCMACYANPPDGVVSVVTLLSTE